MDLIDVILTSREKEKLIQGLGREPRPCELAMISAMWSEHCSYKHSRYFLRGLPQESDRLLAGLGENAGIIQVTDDLALAFKIESHNHPSAVVPFQGAATGVGGILRDIFTMGARPIALLNSLHFDLSHPRGRYIGEHVIEGIADYGNCTGIPTVGGEIYSYPWYRQNPLVNVVCVGRIHPSKVLKSSTASQGDLVLYFGNKTGRDGCEGAIFASLTLTEETRKQKSAVQVADPFMGKLILEASLELIEQGIPSAMQDMGAAGITCSTSEVAHSSGLGIAVELEKVPVRAPDIQPQEILLSESQERMLATVPRSKKKLAEEVLSKYPLDYAWVGELNPSQEIEITYRGETVVDMPLDLLVDGCPFEEYPHLTEDRLRNTDEPSPYPGKIAMDDLVDIQRTTAAYVSKSYIYRQFDHEINLRTAHLPETGPVLLYDEEGDAAISVVVQSRSNWTGQNAYLGTRASLALAFRTSIAGGAYPLGLSNCLNFPSPEREETMVQFGQTTLAMKEACRAWEIPVTGGNVSFYNESEDLAIHPTPVFVLAGQSTLDPRHKWSLPVEGTLYTTGIPALVNGDSFLQHLLRNGESTDPFQVPEIDVDEERDLGRAILDLQHDGAHLWVREVDKGGVFKRLLEFFAHRRWDIRLEGEGQENWLDVLWGEGPLHYLIFVPATGDSQLDENWTDQLSPYHLERLGTVQPGEGLLHFPDRNPLSLWEESQYHRRSLEPLIFPEMDS